MKMHRKSMRFTLSDYLNIVKIKYLWELNMKKGGNEK